MGILRSGKKSIQSHFPVKKWIDTKHVKGGFGLVKSSLLSLRKPKKESSFVDDTEKVFEDYMVSQGMTEEKIVKQIKALRLSVYIYLSFALCLFIYVVHLLLSSVSLIAVFECGMLVCVLLAFSLKNYIQLHLLSTRQLRTTLRVFMQNLKCWK